MKLRDRKSHDIEKWVKSEMTRMRTKPKITDYCYLTTSKHLSLLNHLVKSISQGEEQIKILDIGCGNKPFLSLFSHLDCEFKGIDFSSETEADIVQSLDQPIPAEDESVDFIICSEVLEHVPYPERVISEMFRVLRKGGQLYVTTPFAFPIHARPHDFFRYTEFFYQKMGSDYEVEKIEVHPTNTIFSTPFYTFNQMLMPVPKIPMIIKSILYFLINIKCLVVDQIAWSMFKSGKCRGFTNAFPAGYSVLVKK